MKLVLRTIGNGWIVETWDNDHMMHEISFPGSKEAVDYVKRYLKPRRIRESAERRTKLGAKKR